MKKSAMPDLVCTYQRLLTFVHGVGDLLVDHLPSRRWLTWGVKSWLYGAHGKGTPQASNCVKMVQKRRPRLSTRTQQKMMTVVWAYEGTDWMEDRLRHKNQLSLVPQSDLTDFLMIIQTIFFPVKNIDIEAHVCISLTLYT